jgi:2-oxoisovalerate dehydrogenase E1 component beta subunit
MNGVIPVIEMQFDAFAYPAFDQIASHAAKMGNRTRGTMRLPLVIRIPTGGGIGGVEHHCDSSEGYYVHTPGLTVVAPSTPQDAYSLLRAAIRHPDPVIFMEPKKLYWSKGPVDTSITATIGEAAVVRAGTDVTLLSYGASVKTAIAAAEAAEAEGRSVQVVDVRTLTPFDDDTVMAAVRSTGRAVVISEAPGFASVASEIAARISERCFSYLEAPVRRVTGFDVPYPAPMYEHFYQPDIDRILDAVDSLYVPGDEGYRA